MTRLEMVAALRITADALSAWDEAPDNWTCPYLSCHGADREQMAEFIRRFGKVQKGGADESFWLDHHITEGLILTMFARSREDVCRKIVTTKVLPAEPEKIIPAQPEREVEEVTWDCGEPLLKPNL